MDKTAVDAMFGRSDRRVTRMLIGLFALLAGCVLSMIQPHTANAQSVCIRSEVTSDKSVQYCAQWSQDPSGASTTPSLPSRPPPPKPSSYVAVYWHPDAKDVWAVWNHDHLYDAGFAAYSACTRIMGDGCEKAVEGSLMTVLIAQTPDGRLTQASGKNPKQALQDLERYCSSQAMKCRVIHEFTAAMPKKGRPVAEAHFPGRSAIDSSKLHYAAGFGRNMFHIREKLWVVSGHPTAAAAKKVGGDICWKAEGCSANDGPRFEIDSGFVLIFKNKYGKNDFMDYVVGANKVELANLAMSACRKRSGAACTHGVFLDPRVPFSGEVNFSMLRPWSEIQASAGTLAANQLQ